MVHFAAGMRPRGKAAARPILAAACLIAAGATLWSQSPNGGRCILALTLTDAETDERLAGIVRIEDSDGRIVPTPELLSRGQGLVDEALPIHQWSIVPASGVVKVSLPQKQLTLTALSGLETEARQLALDLRGKSDATERVPLKRFYRAASHGLRSANTHLHLMRLAREQADRYLQEVPAADGLDLLFVSYLERAGADHEYITNRYLKADLARLGDASGVLFGNGEEHRHNFSAQGEGYGHVMFLDIQDLVLPVSIGPGIMQTGTDGLPVQRGIDAARREGAAAVWCHNHWGFENVPNWVMGRLDAQNIFDGGDHGSYEDSFYRFLNAGIRAPFSTGTDWFIYDFARVYAPAAEPLTARSWLKSLAAGKSFITNGPLLELSASGKTLGDTLRLPARGSVEVIARGVGRSDFREIQLIRDGVVIESAKSRPVGGHFEAAGRWTIDMRSSGWLALRTPAPPSPPDAARLAQAPQNEFGKPLFSHTSPIYVEIAGARIFNPAAARDLVASIERSVRRVEDMARFADNAEKACVLQVYHEAIAELQRQLDE
ncbi:MAG TPA: CehA/McbA family metallohydrolase [Planctomycetaceae bacterium]|nr:CehA/McbA family metallohydrolase [Planctomycetaceae bacterium]